MVWPDFLTPSGCYAFRKKTTMDTERISTVESKSDAELMEAVGRRKSDAIQEIYRRYESTLRAVIQSVLHEDGETDDALNEVFLQLWIMRTDSLRKKAWMGF
jgi:hypothetical protein